MADKKQLLQFPCSFPIKIMGRDNPGFRDTVVAIVGKHVGAIDPDAIRTMASAKGNFVSLTITIMAESQQQLDGIYQDLSDSGDVLYCL